MIKRGIYIVKECRKKNKCPFLKYEFKKVRNNETLIILDQCNSILNEFLQYFLDHEVKQERIGYLLIFIKEMWMLCDKKSINLNAGKEKN